MHIKSHVAPCLASAETYQSVLHGSTSILLRYNSIHLMQPRLCEKQGVLRMNDKATGREYHYCFQWRINYESIHCYQSDHYLRSRDEMLEYMACIDGLSLASLSIPRPQNPKSLNRFSFHIKTKENAPTPTKQKDPKTLYPLCHLTFEIYASHKQSSPGVASALQAPQIVITGGRPPLLFLHFISWPCLEHLPLPPIYEYG